MENRYDFGHVWFGFFWSTEIFTIPLSEQDRLDERQQVRTLVQKFRDEGIPLAPDTLVEKNNPIIVEEIDRKARYSS